MVYEFLGEARSTGGASVHLNLYVCDGNQENMRYDEGKSWFVLCLDGL